MQSRSPTSYDSDTIVIESRMGLSSSIPSAISVSSDGITSDNEDDSKIVALTAKDRFYRTISNESLNLHKSVPEHSQVGIHRKASTTTSNRQSFPPRSVCRLLDNEQREDTSTQETSSEEESFEEERSFKEDSGKKITHAESPDKGSFQGVASRQEFRATLASQGARLTPVIVRQQKDQSRLQRLECVSIPPLLVPKSQYSGWKHSLPVSDERSALSRILEAKVECEGSIDFHDVLVEDFVIYRPVNHKFYPGQMVTLDNIVSNRDSCRYLLDGVLRSGETAAYVEAMEIDIDAISIDGFEDTELHSVQNEVYLQTVVCARRRHQALKCWYRLGEPSAQYQDLHKKFLWVADLAKHVIDYLDWTYRSVGDISVVHLEDFQHDFFERLMEWHVDDISFQKWLRWFGRTDFRIPLNRHREFIFTRAYNLGGHYLKHDLWSELMVRPIAPKSRPIEDTVVTPYVQHCCKSMEWSHVLEAGPMSKGVMQARQVRAKNLGFSSNAVDFSEADMAGEVPDTALALQTAVESGSVIDVSAEEALNSFAVIRMKQAERNSQQYVYCFVYIQGIVHEQREAQLQVIFVYLPSETICGDAYYPQGNELFLSDRCNCSASGDPIVLSDILCLIHINVGATASGQDGFFMRQKCVYAEDALCTVRESDFRCPCRQLRSDTRQAQLDERKQPLQGLSLFTGCGNFDLGLEASGAIEITTAIDINECGLKTYAANRSRGVHGLILESVNPCLAQILQGSKDFPGIGSVQGLVAGCPCQGFSRINPKRGSPQSLRNCSLLASTLSYIDTYLPEFALIENVDTMGTGIKNSGNQAIACLVGLGYQVRRLELNCCNYHSCQNRNRLFILAAAPTSFLPKAPIPSRAPRVRASAVSKDLPEVDNDELICVPYPDHIPGVKQTYKRRELIRRVDRYPKGMNFKKSILVGSQATAQLELKLKETVSIQTHHTAFTRLDPDGLIPTITTAPRPTCGRGGGKIIHWDQHRTLTLLEARRAQGFPDDEVIIGDLPQQWYQVGNAVNRQVATAFGKVIADSWFSGRRPVDPEIIVAIPARRNPGQRPKGARHGNRLPSIGHVATDDAPRGPITATVLADEIHKETEALAEGGYDPLQPAALEFVDTKGHLEITELSDTKATKEAPGLTVPQSPNADRDAACWPNTNQMERDEVEFVKAILNPQHPTSPDLRPNPDLTFHQLQRREISTTESSPVGTTKSSVHMIAERSIQVRPVPGTAEHPIDVETEVSVSKRRRADDDDDDDDDEAPRSWVGRRVRSRLQGWGPR